MATMPKDTTAADAGSELAAAVAAMAEQVRKVAGRNVEEAIRIAEEETWIATERARVAIAGSAPGSSIVESCDELEAVGRPLTPGEFEQRFGDLPRDGEG